MVEEETGLSQNLPAGCFIRIQQVGRASRPSSTTYNKWDGRLARQVPHTTSWTSVSLVKYRIQQVGRASSPSSTGYNKWDERLARRVPHTTSWTSVSPVKYRIQQVGRVSRPSSINKTPFQNGSAILFDRETCVVMISRGACGVRHEGSRPARSFPVLWLDAVAL